ncbi:MAG: hypothetical protein AAFN77_11550 [Planctomycetota bacterium]
MTHPFIRIVPLIIVAIAGQPLVPTFTESAPANSIRHVYEDGFVERACYVLIRDDRAFCEYSIGLNPQTAERLLQRLVESAERSPNQTKDLNSSNSPNPGSNAKSDNLPSTQPLGETNQELADENRGEAEHLTDPEVIERFADRIEPWFGRELKVSLNGHRVRLENLKLAKDARHPFSMIVRFEFSLLPGDSSKDAQAKSKQAANSQNNAERSQAPKTNKTTLKPKQIELKLIDQLFKDSDGAVRYALKTKGKAMIAKSNVAPILVRAERMELAKLLTDVESQHRQSTLEQAMTIDATILLSND